MTNKLTTIFSQVEIDKGQAGLSGLPEVLSANNISAGIAILFGIAGGVSLVVIAYGGLKFVLSQGNPQEVTKAKNTIIDGLIGLAIIIASAGIVGFVVEALT